MALIRLDLPEPIEPIIATNSVFLMDKKILFKRIFSLLSIILNLGFGLILILFFISDNSIDIGYIDDVDVLKIFLKILLFFLLLFLFFI